MKTCWETAHNLTIKSYNPHLFHYKTTLKFEEINPLLHLDTFWCLCNFRKYSGKWGNCSWWAISPFARMFSTLIYLNYAFFKRILPSFWRYVFNVVCCRNDVCGKGLKVYRLTVGVVGTVDTTMAALPAAPILSLIHTHPHICVHCYSPINPEMKLSHTDILNCILQHFT